MPFKPPADAPRCAVVDLGSNSVRLVVYEGQRRNPVAIFNEKAVLRLGRGLQATGRLNEEGMGQAFTVMHRYHAVARAMGAEPFEVLATAAVRDARNGADFVAGLQVAHAGRADPHSVRRCRRRNSRRWACCAASRPRTASWPTSAAARWNWCGSIAARAACRRR